MNRIIYLWILLFSAFPGMAGKTDKNEIKVMSFNVRYDNSGDGQNQWMNRKDFACQMVRFHAPDLMGCQEVLHHQLQDMQQRLPGYDVFGVGREDGKERGEYSAVFYNRDRFQLLDGNTFWLAEDPSAVGKKGWDAVCERIVTWVKLKDRQSSKLVYFFNTHFDHIGKIARHESALLLKNKIAEIAGNSPVFVTGDFNAEPTSEVVKLLLDPSDELCLADSRDIASFRYGPEFSYHDYGRLPQERRAIIDYIFVRNIKSVPVSAVITDTNNFLYTSDHYPVVSVIKF